LGARWINPATGKDKGDPFHAEIREECGRREAEESNRLLYVAMTRAEEHLVLSLSHSGKLQNWAAAVQEKLGLNLNCGEVYDLASEFPVQVWSVNTAPERPGRASFSESGESVQVVARPGATDQHDANAAVTSIGLFAECPRRYYLSRYLGWQGRVYGAQEGARRAPVTALSASEFGSEVHSLLAETELEPSHPDTMKLAEAFRMSELGRRAARATRIEREFDFLLAMEDVVLRGQIDLWFEEGGELIVVDYKTDDVDVASAAERAQSYGLQLRLYALALERVTGRVPNKAYVYLLRPNIAIAVDLHPLFLHGAEQTVRAFREAQSNLSFPLNEGEHCRRCPFFLGLCPAGKSRMADVIQPAAIYGQHLSGDEAGLGSG
jgi:ATP-dependent exoDNAse (exonuclease V) beta subunit